MKLKRLIAGIVSTIITVSSLSSSFASVAIDTNDADLKNKVNVENLNDYSIEPVNSLGRILETEMLSDENQEQYSEETKEYGVQDINVEYGKALIAFNTNDNASVIVGLYDEQTGDMITSAAADITPNENYVEAEFDVMPDDYFIAKGYLVDSDTLAPLSEVFENNCYTQEEQEFYSITPEDFDSEKVLLFNKEDKQNFAAFDEKAKIIQYSEGINVLTTNDLENGYYVIENASDEVMNLSPDDIFVMYYGDEMPLMIKVGEVTVNGTTVAIKDIETGIDEIFEFFRMDSGICEPEFNEDDLLDDTEIIYNSSETNLPNTVSSFPNLKKAKDNSTKDENKFNFGIDNTGVAWATYTKTLKKKFVEKGPEYTNRGGYSVLPNQTSNKLDAKVKITGYVSMSIGGELRCSFNKNKTGKKYFKMAINSEIDANLTFSGSVSAAIPLAQNAIEIPLGSSGFKFRIKPEIDIELTGKLILDAKFTKSIGFEYDGTKSGSDSKKPINDTDVASLNLDAEVSLYIGLNLHPSLTWVSEKIFVVDVKEFGAGLIIKATKSFISEEIKEEDNWVKDDDKAAPIHTEKTEKDTCKLCFDIEASIVFKINAEIRILSKKPNLGGIDKNDKNKISFSLPNIHLGYFYLSLMDENWNPKIKFGKGKCPHKIFLCKLNVTDKYTGEKLSNIDVTISDSKGHTKAEGSIGANETARIWLAPGKYTISASSDGYLDYSSKNDLVYKGVREQGKDYGNESYSLYIDGEKTQDIKIKMDSINYDVTVNVVDESNNPVEASIACSYTTKLSFEPLKAAQQLFSSMLNSSKTFKLPNGKHHFTIIASGYETSQQSVEVNNSDSVITVIMKPGSPTDIYDEQTSTTTVDSSLNIGDTGTYDMLSYKVMDDGTITITDCDSSAVNIIIPEIIEGRKVTSIGDDAFYNCENLTSVTIPNSVTSIGQFAFQSCKSLTSITIPDSVTSIGGLAFKDCTSLTSVTIPDSVTSIGTRAFKDCTSLTSITIPDSVTRIDYRAFYDTPWLENKQKENPLVIVNSILIDGTTCSGDIVIPDSVTSICGWAFSYCTSLTSITIPDSVTSIGNDAFYNCTSLTSITIPDSVTSIEWGAFNNCESLTSITIPDSVTSIGSSAFSGCTSLTSITIPDSVTSIGSSTFSKCTSLTSITIPDSVTSIDSSAFSGCTSLTSITIPDSVTSIGSSAFSGCTSLTSITIPDSVTSIGTRAFKDCTSLTDVYYTGTEEKWNSIEIYFYFKDDCLKNATIHYNSTGTKKAASRIQYAPRTAEPTEILTDLWENTLYNVYAMNSRDAENRLSSDNLLYITQTTSDSNGNIDAGYIREKFPHAEIFAVCINGDKPEEQQSDIKVITVSGTGNSLNVPENTLYISSDPSVAEIDKDGNITIVSEGYTAVIAVTDNGCEVVSVLDVKNGDDPPTTSTTTTTTTSTTSTTATETTAKPETSANTTSATDETSTTASQSTETTPSTSTTSQPEQKVLLGDVNGDEKIDAVDASLVLAEYAAIQTGKKGKFTDEQRKAADVNGDGAADAIDASKMLAYYAYIQTGHKVTFKEFLTNSK